jgi:3-hydroxyacyl-CoA dehydrogenase / 3-hydroxy-2-methylbutyryl-CoA dehydrogenase
MDFSKCKALVTGGASGLGEATVRAIISAGGKAAILDLDDSRGMKLTSELGDNSLFIKTDVSSAESVTKAIGQATAIFGQINVAVNCAGIAPAAKVLGKQGPHDLELFNRVLQVNLVGTFNLIRLAAETIAKNEPGADGERGVIINTASVAAFEGQIGQAAYSASKSGIVGLTLPVARELAPLGIRVVTIAPGIMETPMLMGMPDHVREALGKMVPFPQRLGRPEEYAMLARQIIENTMLNGTTIRLDGAIRMQPR